MDSSSSSSSVHASMPISSFFRLPPQDQMAVIQRISPCDKSTLFSIASMNRQINVLATPLLVEAYIGHVENKIKTMKTSAERVAAILLVHRKLMENTSGLPVVGSKALWERLKVLILNEDSCLASLHELSKGIELVILSLQSKDTSAEHVIALQRSCALVTEISQILTRGFKNLTTQLLDAVMYSKRDLLTKIATAIAAVSADHQHQGFDANLCSLRYAGHPRFFFNTLMDDLVA